MVAAGRAAVPLAAALLGFLGVLAAGHREAPAREGRRLEIVDLIREQDERIQRLRGQVARLRRELDGLGSGSGSETARLRSRVERLGVRSGSSGVTGPGVVVTLDDSPERRSPSGDPNDLLIHERDIQTVVNALWAAGAEAVSVNGERLTSLSAVRCAGNTLLLHGTLHSPPYAVAAIGQPARLARVLGRQPGMRRLADSARDFGLGLLVTRGAVRMRGGGSIPDLTTAEPA